MFATAPDDAASPLTSDKPFKRLFSGADRHRLPTAIKGASSLVVADCGALKRADPQYDPRIRVAPPAQPESRSRSVIPPPCRP
jgi:hypothetical protein